MRRRRGSPGVIQREAWQGLNTMIGRAQRPAQIQFPDPASFAKQMDTFYARLDRTDPVGDWIPTNTSYTPEPVTVEEQKVVSILSKLHPGGS